MKQTEALTQALVLAITAPSDKQMRQALKLADQFAHGLSLAQVQQCKAKAEGIIQGMEGSDYE